MGSQDTQSKKGLQGHDLECPTCYNLLDLEDLLTFDGNCPNCFNQIDPNEYDDLDIQIKVNSDDDKEFTFDQDELTEAAFLTMCCGVGKDECECPEPYAGPIFEEGLHEWLNDLPDNIYKVAYPSPCIKCAFQWTGMCKPLIESLMVLNIRDQDYPNKDAPEGEYYLGSIDGCIDYTNLTEKDEYVRQVRITRRRSDS